MAFDGQVEASKAVPRERVRARLEYDRIGPVHLHDLGHDGLEELPVVLVIDSVLERDVEAVVLALGVADVIEVARAREVLPELMEGRRKDAIRGVERLLHAVAVVDVDVDVEHALVVLPGGNREGGGRVGGVGLVVCVW